MDYIKDFQIALKNIACDKGGKRLSRDEYIVQVTNLFIKARKERKKAIFIGNGGSAAIAIHMTADFFKNGGINTYSMLNPSVLTCLANDEGYENVFRLQIERIADEGDILIAISSSGNSPNILRAAEAMRKQNGYLITLSGFAENNYLRTMGNFNLYVPCFEYGIVESIHNLVLQHIVDRMK